jgi:replicative DNA helicase
MDNKELRRRIIAIMDEITARCQAPDADVDTILQDAQLALAELRAEWMRAR